MRIERTERIDSLEELRPGDAVEIAIRIRGQGGFVADLPPITIPVTDKMPVDSIFGVTCEEIDGVLYGVGLVIGSNLSAE